MKKKSFLYLLLVSVLAGCTTLGPVPPPQIVRAPATTTVPTGRLMLGVDVLAANRFAPLVGKRVGLVTHQASVTGRGVRTRTLLQRAPQVNLVALYAPEHGIEGVVDAGVYVSTIRDPITGLPAHSLYGKTRKPSRAQLAGVDTLIFDLQDIGVRSYTYISTMILCMEACGQYGIEFIVLDRPNPMGGLRVEGPPLERRWTSFVGQIPVPYVHGMTAGEIAAMAHQKGWLSHKPRIKIIRMRNWNRRMTWQNTGLRWKRTSPNIPYGTSPLYYAATGMMGGLTSVDIGIGTSQPFQYAGADGANPDQLLRFANSLNTPGVRFSPYRNARKPHFAGVRLQINPQAAANLVGLDVALMIELERRHRILSKTSGSKLNLFHKVAGSDRLARQIRQGVPAAQIIASWDPSVRQFRAQRMPFLLYR